MDTPVVPSSPEALASAKKMASISPSTRSQSSAFFLRAQEILAQGQSSQRDTNTKLRAPLKNARELWDEVIGWIKPPRNTQTGNLEPLNRLSEESETKEIYYLPESPLTEMDLNQMRSMLIYIPDGKKLKIYDVTGNSTWEIWTEFGDPKIKKIPEGKE
jgi:hypothetical protein